MRDQPCSVAPGTQKLRKQVADAWSSYLEFRGIDPSEHDIQLSNSGHAEIITFLSWLLDSRAIKRKASLVTVWHYHSHHIATVSGQPLTAETRRHVNQFIQGLQKMEPPKPKPVFNFVDF